MIYIKIHIKLTAFPKTILWMYFFLSGALFIVKFLIDPTKKKRRFDARNAYEDSFCMYFSHVKELCIGANGQFNAKFTIPIRLSMINRNVLCDFVDKCISYTGADDDVIWCDIADDN